MLYHKKCRNRLLIEASPYYRILAEPVLDKKNLTASSLVLMTVQTPTTLKPSVFYCPVCNETLSSVNDVAIECNHCGEFLDVDVANAFENAPGVYCNERANLMDETIFGKKLKVASVVYKFAMKKP